MRSIREALELWLLALGLGLAILVCLVTISHAATIEIGNDDTANYSHITISGLIELGDVAKFAQVTETALIAQRGILVDLNSPGGVTIEATMIGSLVRQLNATTYVANGSTCTSACALIWIAGTSRVAEDRVTAHAPWEMVNGEPVSVKRERLAPLHTYWKTMGMADDLFEAAMQKGPSEEYQIAGPGMPETETVVFKEEVDPIAAPAPRPVIKSPPRKAKRRKMYAGRNHDTD